MCERWVIQYNGGFLRAEALPSELTRTPNASDEPSAMFIDDTVPLGANLERFQAQVARAYLHKILTQNVGHLQKTAAAAGLTRRTLYTWMKDLSLDARDYK